MTDDEERLARELFLEAVDMPPAQWQAFLEGRTPSDEVRQAVLELLGQRNREGDFLESSATSAYPIISSPLGGRIAEFRIIRELGRGGMGVVYLAEDTVLRRFVALKVLGPDPEIAGAAYLRFEKEAQAAARLSHPAIVQIYRSGRHEQYAYIAMEYVEGRTLREQMTSLSKGASITGDAILPESYKEKDHIRSCARLIAEIADALEHAHSHGVIHRDVKPSNILVDRENHGHLSDFGIARIMVDVTRTTTADLAGSYAYMSPEQARVASSDVDHRTDIFSLGIVLYESLAKKRPFDGPTPQAVLQALMQQEATHLRRLNPAVPADLATICHKAIEKSPRDRYQSAAHVAADLRAFLAGTTILASPPSLRRKVTAKAMAYRWPILATAAGVAVLSAWYWIRQRDYARVLVNIVGPQARLVAWPTGSKSSASQEAAVGVTGEYLKLLPGRYRLVAESSAGAFTELSVDLPEARQSYTFDARVLSEAAVTANMVLIPAGPHKIGNAAPVQGSTGVEKTVSLDAFWIDRTEVTHRAYRIFVEATGHRAPRYWSQGYDVAWDELPVVGVTQDDARAFAAWSGKRLPTAVEWEAAARAPDGRLYPWADAAIPLKVPTPQESSDYFNSTSMGGFEMAMRSVVAAGVADGSATPLGLLHMAGNVEELTDSDYASTSPSSTKSAAGDARSGNALLKGGSWHDRPWCWSAAAMGAIPSHSSSSDLGFRCARSVQAPSSTRPSNPQKG